MTILRRNIFRLWILCSLLWLAFLLKDVINRPPPNDEMGNVAVALLLPPIICFFAGWGLTRVWERFGEARWRRLPEHLRRGLTRLYLVVSVPWVAWFVFEIFNAGTGYRSERDIAYAFRMLLILPIGLPILVWLIVWVFAGFRKSASSSREPTLLDATEAIFKELDLDRLMNDEKFQNDNLPETVRAAVLNGVDCDEIPGAAGEFGRDPRNPIPVNGPLGGVIYLSSLHTDLAQQIMFHRLGPIVLNSSVTIDAYETVSLDGAMWDVLFLDQYHPRKSRRAPTGYQIAADAKRRLLFGANQFVSSFPDKLPDAIGNTCERLLGIGMQPRQVREAIERIHFTRPPTHQSNVDTVMKAVSSLMKKTKANYAQRPHESANKTVPKPFYANTTREERRDWFAHTPPWDRIAPTVIDAILDAITDKVLLEAFVLTSTELGLVTRFEACQESDGQTLIRAQLSQIVCERGDVALGLFIKAREANEMETAGALGALVQNLFEPAIALAKNQIAGYIGMARLYGTIGKRSECHDWAKRGLVEVEEMRREFHELGIEPFQDSDTIPPDALDQMERQLRAHLEH
jgi:hypothetical protein